MAESDRKIRPGEGQLITALAAGQSIAEAAAEAGISERTARRWLAEEELRHRVADARSELTKQALAQLAGAAADAVTTLKDLLTSESDNTKLGAARAILANLISLKEHHELEERLSKLEAQFAQKG
jgi:transposase